MINKMSPKKNLSEKPLIEKAAKDADGPGIVTMFIFFSIHFFIRIF